MNNLSNMVELSYLKKNKNKIKKIFMYRVCGTGMGAAAVLLREKGYSVDGGDIKFAPPMSTYLERTGIPLHDLSSITASDLEKYDLIVVGNVVPRSGADSKKIEESNVKFASFPTTIGALVLDDINVVGIAGTHGKTTTTYLAKQVFEKIGFNVGYFVGGVIEGELSAKLGDGSYFFIESDEYDSAYFEKISKFRLYSIDQLILTSLEFDHADIFNTVDDIVVQFAELIPNVSGKKIFCDDYPESTKLASKFGLEKSKEYLTYGSRSSIGPKVVSMDHKGTEFSLVVSGKKEIFKTNLVGQQNILNITSVILFAASEGVELKKIRSAISDLKLSKRRQEVRGLYKGAIVIDDFAHHPRAVDLTIDSVKMMYPDKQLVVVLAPTSATARSSIFQNEFATASMRADKLIVVRPEQSTSAKNVSDLDCEKIAADFRSETSRSGVVAVSLDDLRKKIDDSADSKSVLLILSNSTCLGLWESSFVEKLQPLLK